MIGSLLVSLALSAPAPASGQPDKVEPLERQYSGPSELQAAPTTGDSATTGQPGTSTIPHVDTDVEPKPRRPVPRLLSTIEGYPLHEQAFVGQRVKFYPGIQVRNHVGYVSAFEIDRFGNEYAEGAFLTGRIRINPRVDIRKKLLLVGMVDLVNGRWAPAGSEDPIIGEVIEHGQPPVEPALPLADFRELYLQWNTAVGVLRIGQQAFTWGEGILANDGNYNDRFGDMRFGDDSIGNLYERILFATKPFKYRTGWIKDLVLAIGGDLVYRDSRVDLRQGDLAGQVLGVARWQPDAKPGTWLGGYMVYRHQRTADDGDVYPDDNDLRVGVADVGGQGTLWLRDRLQLIGSFETALIFGTTTAARDERGGHKVLQGGGAARAYIGHHETWLVGFDTGYASGDPDPNDRWINNFTFDAGHNVGLLMFRQIQGWRTARTEMLATDGELTGVPLNGTQFIPTRGGVTNAVYIHPKARWALWERFEVWGGPLIAAAPVPVIDPYTTRLAGGVPTNSVGGDGGRRFYGTEIDVGVRARFDIRNFWLQAGLQGGLLMPGPALANAQGATGGPVGGIWFRTELRY